MTSKEAIKLTICGGGNGAHTTAGISSMSGDFDVTVLVVYKDKAERWTQAMAQNGFTVRLAHGGQLSQAPGNVKFTVTRDATKAIPDADVVIIVLPAYAHEAYLELIVPHLSGDAVIVGMPGQPGFEYQCLHYLRKHRKSCTVMALETLPWTCRINRYGHDVTVLGFKDEVGVSLIKQGKTLLDPVATVQKVLGKVPVLKKGNNALEIALLSRTIVHPPIMYARWKDWKGEEITTPPLFYQGVDANAEKYLEGACNEIVEVAEKMKRKYPQLKEMKIDTVKQWVVDYYGDQISDKSTLLTSLQTNSAFDGLVHPMTKTDSGKYVPNFAYRYTTEDVPFGLVVQRAIAEMVGINTPIIDEIIVWAQGIIGADFLVDGKINIQCSGKTRIPQMYGLHTIEDLLQFCESTDCKG